MLVREYGGQAGLQEEKRDLYLFSLLSPAWVSKGKSVKINNAKTEMGSLTASINFTEEGAEVSIQKEFHQNPAHIAIPIPYFKELISHKSNAKNSFIKDGVVFFSPDVTEISFVWKNNTAADDKNYQDILVAYRSEPSIKWNNYDQVGNPKDSRYIMDKERGILTRVPGIEGFLLDDELNYPATSLSFDLVVKAFTKEYSRKFEQYTKAGKKPIITEPLYMLSSEEREQLCNEENRKSE